MREREALDKITALKERIEQLQFEGEKAQRSGQFEQASRIIYGELPTARRELEARQAELEEIQAGRRHVVREGHRGRHREGRRPVDGHPRPQAQVVRQEKLMKMEDNLHARVVGQHDAVVSVSDAVRRARAGLQDPNRPIGSFMFLGPPASARPSSPRRSPSSCSTTRTPSCGSTCPSTWRNTVARLIGAPPGYVGYDEGGQLTEAVRRRPYSVVLFDEIEKAHPDVFNILLQVLDDGRLTDSKGRVVDFKNTVVIMTSNIGSLKILEAGGDRAKAVQAVERGAAQAVQARVPQPDRRPDRVRRRSRAPTWTILDIQLKRVRHCSRRAICKLEVTPSARTMVCDLGYDPAFGARPLKRAITTHLLNPMSSVIIEGGFEGGDTIRIDGQGDKLVFLRIPADHVETEAPRQIPENPASP
jgi:ATP-dependent Clp protease ATP-binding subunit ClpB